MMLEWGCPARDSTQSHEIHFHKFNMEKLMCVTYKTKCIKRRCAFHMISLHPHQLNGEDSKDVEEYRATDAKSPNPWIITCLKGCLTGSTCIRLWSEWETFIVLNPWRCRVFVTVANHPLTNTSTRRNMTSPYAYQNWMKGSSCESR